MLTMCKQVCFLLTQVNKPPVLAFLLLISADEN